jgi:hypothetical protein
MEAGIVILCLMVRLAQPTAVQASALKYREAADDDLSQECASKMGERATPD